MTQMDSITDKLSELIQQLKDKDDEFKTKDEELNSTDCQLQQVEEQMRTQSEKSSRERALLLKANQRLQQEQDVLRRRLPPRNWTWLEHQKMLECSHWCFCIAVQGDVVYVGVKERILHFSRTTGERTGEIELEQMTDYARGVAFIDEDTIVVSADDNSLRTYNTKGQLVRTLGSEIVGFDPRGLTVDPDGRIFVCDYGNHCVRVFNVDGKLLSSFGSEGRGVGQFNSPWDVCMDGEGLLFISDSGNSRICVHSVEGKFIREFPTPGVPFGLAATPCNHLVVTFKYSNEVRVMTTTGDVVHKFGEEDKDTKRRQNREGVYNSPGGMFKRPLGVAVDIEDCVYVCDEGYHRVQVYTHQLQ